MTCGATSTDTACRSARSTPSFACWVHQRKRCACRRCSTGTRSSLAPGHLAAPLLAGPVRRARPDAAKTAGIRVRLQRIRRAAGMRPAFDIADDRFAEVEAAIDVAHSTKHLWSLTLGRRAGAVVRCAGTGRPRLPAGGRLACGHRRGNSSVATATAARVPAISGPPSRTATRLLQRTSPSRPPPPPQSRSISRI